MESGSVKKAFIFGIIMILAVLAVVFAANGDRLDGKKSGTDEQSSSSDSTSDTGQVGSDLNAFMNDDSFFDSSFLLFATDLGFSIISSSSSFIILFSFFIISFIYLLY